jgi:hypothetical protein
METSALDEIRERDLRLVWQAEAHGVGFSLLHATQELVTGHACAAAAVAGGKISGCGFLAVLFQFCVGAEAGVRPVVGHESVHSLAVEGQAQALVAHRFVGGQAKPGHGP